MGTENKIIAQSERLYVRNLHYDDQAKLFNIYSDKEAMKYRSTPAFESLEDARKMIDKTIEQIESKKEFRLGIVENDTNELVGTFLYKIMDKTTCEVGYSLGKAYWKLGYGYEILNTMLHYLNEIGFKNIIATTKKENAASIKLLTKAGFQLSANQHIEELNLFEKYFN